MRIRLFIVLVLLACTAAPALVSAAAPLVVEDHSQALCHWYKTGIRGATLVHIDDHDDFYSSLVQIESNPEAIRSAFEGQACGELETRTSFQIQSDALYGIADFIYPAWQLGVVTEVWWVMAEKERLDSEWLEKFKLQKAHRYPADFLTSLQLKENRIEGVLKGMPVRMLSLKQLPAFEKPILLDIDVDYFLGLYESPLEKQMITQVGDFFRQLFRHKLDTEMVTISVSSNGGYTPVRFRYLGDWLNQAFSDLPGLMKNGPPKTWRLQSGIESADYLLDRDQAARLNGELEQLAPDAGLPAYNRAWIAAQQGDLEGTLKWQNVAVQRDSRYVLGFQELAGKFRQIGRLSAADALLQRGIQLEPQRASFYTHFGSLLIDAGRLDAAVEVFDSGVRQLPQVAILRAGLAFALARQKQTAAAETAFAEFEQLAQPGQNTEAVRTAWQQLH